MKRSFLVFISLLIIRLSTAQVGVGILPSETDPAINNPNNSHIAYYNTSVTHKNKLFVFFPGTGGTPFGYQEILKTAADLGYHSIGLMYPNAQAINSICGASTDTTCHRMARQEVLEGVDVHPTVTVDRINSIENRLIKLLKYLDVQYPTFGWDQYLTNDSVITWDKYVVAGHSQGGGHAGFIGKVRTVDRVLMFAAADWIPLLNRNADWITIPGLTPMSNYYALIHDQDEQIPFSIEQTTWQNYGLFDYGNLILVDTAITPYGNSRTLYTQLTPNTSATAFHNAPVVDMHTPVDGSSNLLLEPVWEYMLEGGGLSALPENSEQLFLMFPNPATEFIYINAQLPLDYALYDISGRMIRSGNSTSGNIELYEPAGIYLLSIANKEGTSTQKLIIR